MKARYITIRVCRLLLIFQIRSKKHFYILYRNLFSFIQIDKENNKKSCEFSAYYKNNLNGGLLKINATESHNLPATPQITQTINSNFSLIKNSFQRKTISYICDLRTRIECEPVSEHSTRK